MTVTAATARHNRPGEARAEPRTPMACPPEPAAQPAAVENYNESPGSDWRSSTRTDVSQTKVAPYLYGVATRRRG